MYIHPAFTIDRAEALRILRERGFGLFVVTANDGPVAVHVPFLVDEGAGDRLTVTLHVARANPIHTVIASGARALLACQGPDAYISPDWYGIADQVPTWTYTAVHLTGTARLLPEPDYRAHVDRLSAMFEARLAPKKAWTSDKMDQTRLAAMLKAIVVVSLEVDRIEGQMKLSQHKGAPARRGAIAGLEGRGDAASLAIAALMQEALARETEPRA
jgi:transcriptional regulator